MKNTQEQGHVTKLIICSCVLTPVWCSDGESKHYLLVAGTCRRKTSMALATDVKHDLLKNIFCCDAERESFDKKSFKTAWSSCSVFNRFLAVEYKVTLRE